MEESFNIQATFDLLYKRWDAVLTFDHVDFPGVVPRTFVGPIVLTVFASIPKLILALSSYQMLHVVRFSLGAIVSLSLLRVRNALARRYDTLTAFCFTMLTIFQFHVPFYASRPLPNMFAFIFTNFALADRIVSSQSIHGYRAIALLAIAVALFRSELSLYLFPTILSSTVSDPGVKFFPACSVALISAIITATVSIFVDSHFWNCLAYPELEVFHFNVILNKSSAWGTEPWHWYFSNALPRACGGALLLAFLAIINAKPRVRPVVFPSVVFVAIYSILPHKELRFIIYTIPAVNAAAAVTITDAVRAGMKAMRGCAGSDKERSYVSRRNSALRFLLYLSIFMVAVATMLASMVQTIISTAASRYNYPAAYALRRMHVAEKQTYTKQGFCGHEKNSPVTAFVHVDVDSAMNGISQYVYERSDFSQHSDGKQNCPIWTYSKEENVDDVALRDRFTHLVSERRHIKGFCLVLSENGYSGVRWREMRLNIEPRTFVHRNINVSTENCFPEVL